MEEQHTVFLGTGSNIGDRNHNLWLARREIELRVGAIAAASGIYQTAPWGMRDQPDYLNQALKIRTFLDPESVLDRIQAIEKWMGRTKEVKWGARVIDIDILFYDDLVLTSRRLSIPHPHIADRRFVLVPLREIAAGWLHPVFQKTIAELAAETTDPLPVEFYSSNVLH